VKWRMKSRPIWVKYGDENTKFFYWFARAKKAYNSILYIKMVKVIFVTPTRI
jgi:hypothetical protein